MLKETTGGDVERVALVVEIVEVKLSIGTEAESRADDSEDVRETVADTCSGEAIGILLLTMRMLMDRVSILMCQRKIGAILTIIA